jgi:mono/diheme cytochrome c family protein
MRLRFSKILPICLWLVFSCPVVKSSLADDAVAQQVRSIFSNRCFACHGPDPETRQGGFRLDKSDSMLAEADSGEVPVVPGDPEASELLRRITSGDEGERMPPPDFGQPLEPSEMALVKAWIEQGARLPQHWSFVPPERPALPDWERKGTHAWSSHPVDRFVEAQQLAHGLQPSPPAERAELLRRVSLDLTGLPPTSEQLAEFESDTSPNAYERQVDRLLADPAYGEHWARKWLDLARYADSAGYADDPPRTIWGYRDWVIDAYNQNEPIDQFTVDQIAGDLLPNATQRQLIATAFHRNTLTNNEGGTNDEEFRNVAVVDRVNTTMAVWMGVTMACAQCHTHKYDPFTQEEYFKLFAIFNQTQDADRRDESPSIDLLTTEQLQQKQQWQNRIQEIELSLDQPSEEVLADLRLWEQSLGEPSWRSAKPLSGKSRGNRDFEFGANDTIRVLPTASDTATDTYELNLALDPADGPITGIGIRTVPDADLPQGGAGLGVGNFVVTNITASLLPAADSRGTSARYVRIDLPGKQKILSLAEVQVFAGDENLARESKATQSSTDYMGEPGRAIDGDTDGEYTRNSTTHTRQGDAPWWELDLGAEQCIDRLVIWNRTDNGLQNRLDGAQVQLLDENRNQVYEHTLKQAPQQSQELAVRDNLPIRLVAGYANYAQSGFPAAATVDSDKQSGWAVGGSLAEPHLLTLIPEQPIEVSGPAQLHLKIEHNSPHRNHLLGSFRVELSNSPWVADWSQLDAELLRIHNRPMSKRTSTEQQKLTVFYNRHISTRTQGLRSELSRLQQQLQDLKPETSVPIMRQLASDSRRETYIQIRGNYKALGAKVTPGMPAVFDSVMDENVGPNEVDRLALAKWLVDRGNPLTARVWVNRLWESLFGIGIVRSSEDFGSQGDKPSHPELLDWLACQFMDQGWDQKRLLRLLVTSQTYRQTSRVSPRALESDQENIWLARGPRVRLSAEMVRDQALQAAGLLSDKMYGPPVRPPQPNMGLKAAFGSDTDWKTSGGEDRYRRGLYTTWRRSNPYPSMATFDAPSREVCTLRRDSTNTPLQALVTLNDPGFVEAAQGVARRVVLHSPEIAGSDQARLRAAFRLCTSRQATAAELAALEDLLADARKHFEQDRPAAVLLATDPLGPLDDEADPVELAAWTSLSNVLLNLDEVLMKR